MVRYLPKMASARIAPKIGVKYALATNQCIHSRDWVSVMYAGAACELIRYCDIKTTRIVFIP